MTLLANRRSAILLFSLPNCLESHRTRIVLKENEISQNDLVKFIDENKDKLKIEYLDFNYAKISPKIAPKKTSSG